MRLDCLRCLNESELTITSEIKAIILEFLRHDLGREPTKMKELEKLDLSKERLLSMYKEMVLIRAFEDKLFDLYSAKQVVGTTHLYAGQEAIAVGVSTALRPNDYTLCTYRGHGVLIARGSDLNKVAAEIFGKATGLCKGKGGSMHLTDFSRHVLGSFAIVSAHLPIAVGAALSAKMRGTNQISVAFFGDGATNIGAFHEALNMASVWKLPVLFVCENNLYGEHTPIHLTTAAENVSERASAYNMLGLTVDGNDVLEVYHKTVELVRGIRSGQGPALMECRTYRLRGHSRDDAGLHRPKEEVEMWKQRDPIKRFSKYLIDSGHLDDGTIQSFQKETETQVEKAIQYAIDSSYPAADTITRDVFGGDS